MTDDSPRARLTRWLRGILNTEIDWDDRELVESDCPSCGSEEYYFKSGPRTGFDVYRCRECGYEAISR